MLVLVTIYETSLRHLPEDSDCHNDDFEKLRSRNIQAGFLHHGVSLASTDRHINTISYDCSSDSVRSKWRTWSKKLQALPRRQSVNISCSSLMRRSLYHRNATNR
jgi:hypothetical protein